MWAVNNCSEDLPGDTANQGPREGEAAAHFDGPRMPNILLISDFVLIKPRQLIPDPLARSIHNPSSPMLIRKTCGKQNEAQHRPSLLTFAEAS